MKQKIFCLFSIANDHNQPENNLVAWYSGRPTLEQLARGLGLEFKGDDNILDIVNIHQGPTRRIGDCDYRLESVAEGERLLPK